MAAGLGFALIGLTMMVVGIGVAGMAAPPSEQAAAAPVARPIQNQRLEVFQEATRVMGAAMPVP